MPRKREPTADRLPTKPGSLLGVSEIAELAGISRQRASVLSQRESFPRPVVQLKMGLIWEAAAVQRWLDRKSQAS